MAIVMAVHAQNVNVLTVDVEKANVNALKNLIVDVNVNVHKKVEQEE